jgi:hypothetical protein
MVYPSPQYEAAWRYIVTPGERSSSLDIASAGPIASIRYGGE